MDGAALHSFSTQNSLVIGRFPGSPLSCPGRWCPVPSRDGRLLQASFHRLVECSPAARPLLVQ
ncbi:MAG: hypothetical protein Q8P67_09015 [archaeon]|nr:hypothetical protein [archaeon]